MFKNEITFNLIPFILIVFGKLIGAFNFNWGCAVFLAVFMGLFQLIITFQKKTEEKDDIN